MLQKILKQHGILLVQGGKTLRRYWAGRQVIQACSAHVTCTLLG